MEDSVLDFSSINAEVSYNPTPKITIKDSLCNEYLIQLYYKYKGEWTLHYAHPEFTQEWWLSFVTTRNKWRFKVFGFEGDRFKLLLQNTYNETGQKVVFRLHSESSKIDEAYINKAIEFQKQNCCFVFVKTRFSKLLKNLGNPFVNIVDMSANIDNTYAAFDIRQNEILTKREEVFALCNIYSGGRMYHYRDRHWPAQGKALETWDHQHDWRHYSPADVFDDIIHYE